MRLGFNFWLGATLTALVIFAGVLAHWIAPFDPVLDADLMNSELPPDATFWFGTDGQDGTSIPAFSTARRSR